MTAGAASSHYTGRVQVSLPCFRGAVVSRPRWRGWIPPCAAAAGRQRPLEEAGFPAGDGWRHWRLLQLWRNRLLSPQGLITPEPAPRFPLPWITVSWSSHKAFHRWSRVRSTMPSTLQHKVLILGQGAGVWSWPQAEGSPWAHRLREPRRLGGPLSPSGPWCDSSQTGC